MRIKMHIKNLVMRSSVLRELYFRVKSLRLKQDIKRRYGSLSRKGIFESIYTNFTMRSSTLVQALTQIFMYHLTAN